MPNFSHNEPRQIVIFGGAGFIGSNWAAHLLMYTNARIHIVDNLSRKGSQHNLQWLRRLPHAAERLELTIADVRNASLVNAAVAGATEIYQFAAQVAVTDSVKDPRNDFEVNLQGTFNVLEAARLSGLRPFVLFTSTNKVYGECSDSARCGEGVSEEQPLDFHSPYGCSKGAADHYVRDYARIYDLPTVVFRMSCIAGPRQWGNEDQGWVAHFLYSALQDATITIYGDGKQVRDVLHICDLVRAFETAREHAQQTAGKIFNLGGGRDNAVSLIEVIQKIRRSTFRPLKFCTADTRPGDQQVYITDHSKFSGATGWAPHFTVEDVLRDIELFWHANREAFEQLRKSRERDVLSEALGAA